MAREIQKLRALARRWGGDLVEVSEKEWDRLKETRVSHHGPGTRSFHEAPFTGRDLGVHWPSRRVIYHGEVQWVEVIHEMGHAFATPKDPDSTDELDFFGWEYSLVKAIGASEYEWVTHNKDYGVYGVDEKVQGEFGDLSPKQQTELLKKLVAKGKELGIIDSRGRPLSVPRVLDMGAIQLSLSERSKEFRSRAKMTAEGPIRSGKDFENMCERNGFAEGYDQAVQDVLSMLYAMTTGPVSTSG
jgi:hypothetical protein